MERKREEGEEEGRVQERRDRSFERMYERVYLLPYVNRADFPRPFLHATMQPRVRLAPIREE